MSTNPAPPDRGPNHIAKGRLLQQWIDGPPYGRNVPPCLAQPCRINFNSIHQVERIERDINRTAERAQALVDFAQERGLMLRSNTFYRIGFKICRPVYKGDGNSWEGVIAPGKMIVEFIQRDNWVFASEQIQAVYEHFYEAEPLRTIFFLAIVNQDTKDVLNAMGKDWADSGGDWREERVLRYGEEDYHRVLGTKLGKVVGYFVLGAYGAGTKRITEIGIDYEGGAVRYWNLRFEIRPRPV